MTTFQKFKRALVVMKEKGELDKILNVAAAKNKAKVEHDIEYINELAEVGVDNVSAISVIMELQSVAIFKNALCFMNDIEEA